MSALLANSLRSSTFRVALLCVLIFGAFVVALFSYVYLATDSYILNRVDRAIDADRADLIAAYRRSGQQGLIVAIHRLKAERARTDTIYLLADPLFQHVAGDVLTWPTPAQQATGRVAFASPDQRLALLDRPAVRASVETLSDGYHLLVGRDVSDLNEFMAKIHLALSLALLLVFTLAAASSVIATRRTIGRIEAINATSRAIMRSGLSQRVPLRGTRDEWDQLAKSLNAMLDRIETLMNEVKQVSDNVAHDLRTPLTRMRGRLEKASFESRDADADQAMINETMADLDELLSMFSSLTRISQVETTSRMAAFKTVDLVEVAKGAGELFDASAEERGTHLEIISDRPVLIKGDRDLLFDALANLIDNAIKHGRDGGKVTVGVARRGDAAVISVRDDGPGIPKAEYQNVFRRFYRLEHSRSTPGNGLGLSLVAAIAHLHDAVVTLRDNDPGLEVELRLPLAPDIVRIQDKPVRRYEQV